MSIQLPSYPPEQQNVTMSERSLSVIVGLAMAAAAVRPRPNPLLNIAALAIGSYLAFRGATGYCPVKAELEAADLLGPGGSTRTAISPS